MRQIQKFARQDGDGDGDAGAEPFGQRDGADVKGEGEDFKTQVTSPRKAM
jgi:hypothetical protein